jgi:hypothetical protein
VTMLNNYVATLSGAGATGGAGGILLSDVTVFDSAGFLASAGYSLTSAGDILAISSSFGATDIGDWASPKSLAPGSYEVRADLDTGSGGITSGTLGTWLALTSTRTWTLERLTTGVSEATIVVQIRLSSTVLTSAKVTLYAEAFASL